MHFATPMAFGLLLAVLICGAARARTDVFSEDAFSDDNGSDAAARDDYALRTGWWTPANRCPDSCGPGTAGEYCLPGNPNAPVIIDQGACPPGALPPPAYAPFPGALPGALPGTLPGAMPGALPGAYAPPPPADPLLPYVKNGLLQRVEFTTTYLPRNGGGGIGFDDLDGFAFVSIPLCLPGDKSALLITPDIETHFVDGPDEAVLPHRLYDASVLVQFISQLPDNVLLYAGAEPGWHSDAQNTSSDDYRTALYAAIGYRFSPTFAAAVGVGYLDRRDIGLIPLAGLIWVPTPDIRIELVPPKPRIERRICAGNGYDDWLYIGGEMGGGQWAIERPDGTHDVASYLDYRALLGVERRSTCGGLGGLAEVGYVFGRRLEYAGAPGTYDPPDTVMARLGLIY
ncbi:MAG TPA: hypothetical protein VHX65_18445 [Pirellulales bacterium]|nr:hypothetical protein [Pirellulales bacterium]